MRFLCLAVAFAAVCGSAHAQREFIEEVQSGKDVDLDAPDPVNKPPPPPAPPPPPDAIKPPVKDPIKADPPKPDPAKADPAKSDPARKNPGTPGATEPAPDDGTSTFDVVATDRDAFMEKASPHFSAIMRGEQSRARKSLPGLQRGALEAAIHGLPEGFAAPAMARALTREATVAIADGRTEDATELVDMAMTLAPSDLSTLLTVARIRMDTVGVAAVIGDAGAIAAAAVANPIDRGNITARVAASVMAAILALLVIVTLTIAVPLLPVTAFELLSRLPRGIHPVQGWFLVAAIGLAPLLLGLGVVPALLWLCLLPVAAYRNRTRVVVGLVMASTLALPIMVTTLAKGWTSASSPAATIYRALYDIDGAADVRRLAEADAAGLPVDLLGKVAVANAARREGRLQEALASYRALVQRHGDVSWVHGGYATALASAGDTDLALAEFGLAVERSRSEASGRLTAVPASFNASLLHHAAGRPERAQAMIAPLAERNATLLAGLRRATFRAVDERVNQNRAVAEVLPPRAALNGLLGGPAADALEARVDDVLWKGNATDGLTRLGSLLALFAILAVVFSRVGTAHACERCGEPASSRADGPEVPEGTCAACFHAFVSTSSRVDASIKLRKENAIRRRDQRRARVIIIASIIPGAGHLYAGTFGRGLPLAAFGMLSLAGAIVASPLWPSHRVAGDVPAWLFSAPFILACAVTLAVAVRSALVIAEEERGAR